MPARTLARAGAATVAGQVASYGILGGAFLVAARLAGSDAIGRFALASTGAGLVSLLVVDGVGPALLRRSLGRRADAGVEWAGVVAGAALGAVAVAAAVVLSAALAAVTGDLGLLGLGAVCALGAFPLALGAVWDARLQTAGRFADRAVAETAGGIAGAAAIIAGVLVGGGAWALVAGYVTNQVTVVGAKALLAGVPRRPTTGAWRAELGPLARFAATTFGAATFPWIVLNVDTLTVGALRGTEAAGTYAVALTLGLLPGRIVVTVVASVVLVPLLARSAGPGGRAAQDAAARRGVAALAAIGAPAAAITVAIAGPALEVGLGSDFGAAAGPLRALAVAGLLVGVTTSLFAWAKAAGRPDLRVRAGVAEAACAVVFVVAGTVAAGPLGAALGACGARVVSLALTVVLAERAGLPFGAATLALARPALAALAAAPAGLLASTLATTPEGAAVLAVTVAVAVYALVAGRGWRSSPSAAAVAPALD